MKKLHAFLTIIVMLLLSQSYAKQITEAKVNIVAHNFYFERFNNKLKLNYDSEFVKEVIPVKMESTKVIYFINYINGGWVAVSACDAVIPIVAYSYKGNYNPNNYPDNFASWITQYKKQILFAITNSNEPTAQALNQWQYYSANSPQELLSYSKDKSVEPLITTSWDQGFFYNQMCPADAGGPGGHCYVGCVPTTMGQICNYYRFPQTGTGSYSYECPPYGELSADFGSSTYNWDEMPLSVHESSLSTAQILYHLGVSVDLVYGPDGSGMYNHKAAYALRTHFKYSPETEYVYRDSTNLNWDSILISHLDRKMPMYYAGWSVPNINGHAFVCDGYEDSNYFHFNWGWSGSYDGYFFTDDLTPGGSNFNLAQEVIINCFPDTVAYQYPYYCQGADTITSTSGTFGDGSGPVYNYLDDLNCSWLISPSDSVNFIILEFTRFNLSENDTLFIFDGDSDNDSLLGMFTGSTIPENIISTSDELFVRFITDGENTEAGWLIGFSSEIPQYCNMSTLTEPAGTIQDGSGPANYHNLTTCFWTIQPEAPGMDIYLTFINFNTEEGHDFVTVYDGNNMIGEYSGNELPPTLSATSGTMTVIFSTNASITQSGWEAYYSTSPVGTAELARAELVSIFPNPVKDVINIKFAKNAAITNVFLFDLYGKLVVQTSSLNCKQLTVNTSGLSDGVYLLKISQGNKIISKKVIIRK